MMLFASLLGGSLGCSQSQATMGEEANAASESPILAANKTQRKEKKGNDTKGNDIKGNDTKDNKMKIKIGSKIFHATLFDNATATAFRAMLPLTLNMDELNGNEKKHDFSKSLPTDSFNPKTINNGDLMLWGSNTLVLFYKTFSTQYPYTKLGRIDDPSELEAAVGSGNVTMTFEVE
jgi:hypothetical protein